MQKKKYITLFTISIVAAVLSIITIILYFFPFTNGLKTNEIYKQSLQNVVEVKAETANVGQSFGTGEIISKDGKIVTNAHVVTYSNANATTQFDTYTIRFSFEEQYRPVELEKYDSNLDLAVLKLKDTSGLNLKPIKIGNSSNLQAGDTIYAVGNASNYGIGIFQGTVSNPLINVVANGVTRAAIQCDLTIAAGNSGGALLNTKGELVGITTFRVKDTSGNVVYGIVYSVPINIVLDFVNQ